MSVFRAGIIGLGQYGQRVLRAIGGNSSFKIQAIGDRDPERAKEFASKYQAQWYDDYRSLIVQEKLDVLFLTLPTFLCNEYIQLAGKLRLHVFKAAPLGRSLPEAAQWVEQLKKAKCQFYVGSQRRFAPGYLEAHQLLSEGRIGQVYLARGECFLARQDDFTWRGDPVLSGGGVLLEMAYHTIDQIVWGMGSPERVYSLNTNQCSKKVQPPYRTEDTVVLTMKFPDGSMGNVLAGWMTGPSIEKVVFHGTDGTIQAQSNAVRLYDDNGQVVISEDYNVDLDWLMDQEIRYFVDMLIDDEVKPVNTAQEHLANIAIIESAYLSTRTQLPETMQVYGSLFGNRSRD